MFSRAQMLDVAWAVPRVEQLLPETLTDEEFNVLQQCLDPNNQETFPLTNTMFFVFILCKEYNEVKRNPRQAFHDLDPYTKIALMLSFVEVGPLTSDVNPIGKAIYDALEDEYE